MSRFSLRQYHHHVCSHSHDFAQLVIPLVGPLEIEVQGQGRHLAPGFACVIAPGERHDYAADPALSFLVQESHWLPEALDPLLNPELTYSARLLKQLLESGQDNGCFGDALASRYREEMLSGELQYWDEAYFAGEAKDSLAKQRERERSDSLSFDDFLADYFGSSNGTLN